MRTAAAILLLATPLAAAPVPRDVPEPPLTAERLVGVWEYRYGGLAAGEIVFYANGDYLSHHGGQYGYAGLHFPDQEFVDYDGTFGASFRGAVVVFYRRAIGKRLPRSMGDPLSPPEPQPESP